MPRDHLLVILDHVRIWLSYYCNLHWAHCDRYKRLMEPSQLPLQDNTALIRRCCLRNVSVAGGEPPFDIVLLCAVAIAHANKQGLQVQSGEFGQIPIADVTSIFDHRESLTFRFSFDRAEGENVYRFRGTTGVHAFVLRQMFGAVTGRALEQARMTANRDNLIEAPDVYLQLPSIGIDPFSVKPVFASRPHTQQPGRAFPALPSYLPTRPRFFCNSRLPDRRPLAGRGKSRESTGLWEEPPINVFCCAEQPRVLLATAA